MIDLFVFFKDGPKALLSRWGQGQEQEKEEEGHGYGYGPDQTKHHRSEEKADHQSGWRTNQQGILLRMLWQPVSKK